MKSRAGPAGGGGMGMKCRNIFEPKTTNTTPSRLRAMIIAIFILFLSAWFSNVGENLFLRETDFRRARVFVSCCAISDRGNNRARVALGTQIKNLVVLRAIESFHRTSINAEQRGA